MRNDIAQTIQGYTHKGKKTISKAIIHRGGYRISGKGVHMYNECGVFALLILSTFRKYPMKMK